MRLILPRAPLSVPVREGLVKQRGEVAQNASADKDDEVLEYSFVA
jgi:hypothetical protein